MPSPLVEQVRESITSTAGAATRVAQAAREHAERAHRERASQAAALPVQDEAAGRG